MTCSRGSCRLAGHPPDRAARHVARDPRRNDARPRHRVLQGDRRRHDQPRDRRAARDPADPPRRHRRGRARQPLDVDGDHRHRRGLLPDHRAHGASRRARGGRSRLRRGGTASGRARSVRDVLGGASERHATDPRRGDDPARVRDLRGRDAQLHRVRTAAAVTRLGGADRRQLPSISRSSGGQCSSPRSRSRRSSSRSTSSRTRSSRCSSDERSAALELRELDVVYTRARDRSTRASRCVVRDRSRRVVRARRRVGVREVDCRACDRPLPRAERAVSSAARSLSPGSDVLGLGGGDAPRVPSTGGVDGLPEPRRGTEPVDPGRRAGRGGVHGARRVAERRPGARARERSRGFRSRIPARSCRGTRTSSRAACSSAS